MQRVQDIAPGLTSAQTLVAAFIVCCAIASAAIGAFPLQLSIVTIFLFAGVHNVMEFRYFAARMPVLRAAARPLLRS